jgi:predicted O-linked N-acetylglucosamine transferase (SPINDLY family)
MPSITVEQALLEAIDHYQAGRLVDAERIYRQILAYSPNHDRALCMLGIVVGQAGHPASTIDLLGRAIAINPSIAEYHYILSQAYLDLGQWENVISSARRAIELRPELAEAHANLGIALHKSRRLDEAIFAYRQAVDLKPDVPNGYRNLAVALQETGRVEEAVAACRRAVEIKPDSHETYKNLGLILRSTGRAGEAVAAFRRAIEIKPDYHEAHNDLAVGLNDEGRFAEAIAACARAIEIKPAFAEPYSNLGSALREQGRIDEAIAALEHAVRLSPDLAEAHNELGNVFKEQGRLDEAIACYRQAVQVKPDFLGAASNILLALHYHPDYGAQAILTEHRNWARRHADPLAGDIRPHRNDRDPERRLRVGFVSPDFREHPVARQFLPLLVHHDRRHFEVVCYSNRRAAESLTERFKALADQWRDIAGLGDSRMAELIRDDRIDILVDLALHTASNRMLVFARKSAPVQVTMLGMPSTTGLSTIDYRLSDPILDPPGSSEQDYTERTVRLPHCYWNFEPPEEAIPVGELPARKNGFVTFGCLNQFAKINRRLLQVWLRILQALPHARLVIQAPPGRHLDSVRALFQTGGIPAARLEFVSRTSRSEYLHRLQSLDIGLDPFPYNGHTSSLDALWMGVPVITLAGGTGVGRGGMSILSNAGLPELIAPTTDDYARIAVMLATDLERLGALRASLRPRMLASPLVDVKQYTADVESLFRSMWRGWCGLPETQ